MFEQTAVLLYIYSHDIKKRIKVQEHVEHTILLTWNNKKAP